MKKKRYDRQRNWTINVNNFRVFPERFSRFTRSHSVDMSQFNVFWAVFSFFFRPSCLSPTGAWIIKRKYCRPPLAHSFISRRSYTSVIRRAQHIAIHSRNTTKRWIKHAEKQSESPRSISVESLHLHGVLSIPICLPSPSAMTADRYDERDGRPWRDF